MIYHELDTVVLKRDVPERGLKAGDLGAVVHVHSHDALEVEFVLASGHTQALAHFPQATCGRYTSMISLRREPWAQGSE